MCKDFTPSSKLHSEHERRKKEKKKKKKKKTCTKPMFCKVRHLLIVITLACDDIVSVFTLRNNYEAADAQNLNSKSGSFLAYIHTI